MLMSVLKQRRYAQQYGEAERADASHANNRKLMAKIISASISIDNEVCLLMKTRKINNFLNSIQRKAEAARYYACYLMCLLSKRMGMCDMKANNMCGLMIKAIP